MADDKKTSYVKVWLSEPLELELRRLAEHDERKLSDFVGLILRRYVYGNGARASDELDGANRGASPHEM